MNEIKYLVAAIAMTTAFNANAEFMVKIPLEISNGGGLENGSLKFVGENTNAGSGSGNDDNDGEVTPPIESMEPDAQCDAFASEANIFLQSQYSDVHMLSYEYKTIVLPPFGAKQSCVLTLEVPEKKGATCTGNSTYTGQLGSDLSALGAKYTVPRTYSYSYYGGCE
ncbi:hypothetical protein [Pseudomonas aeruginosa]|uniref:hypothetical protein n=1 Tax=Pseudomonas aeruginosa TaxID=287 RepID=UPI001F03363C|nr:hypothetical protein [Pseudomonas aeruginosa]